MMESEQYYRNIISELGLLHAKPTNEPSTNSTSTSVDLEEPVDEETHALYRRMVGKLQWVVVLRPDLAYTVKELARSLTQPTRKDMHRLKHCVKYIKGTLHYRTTLQPQVILSSTGDTTFDVHVHTDANWAGCAYTRKSTTGVLVQFLCTCVNFSSKTQTIHAMSSAESELYAMNAGSADGLHLRAFLLESGLAGKTEIFLYTDSSAAKSIASQFGLSRKTRHVQLRFLFLQDLVQTGLIRLKKVGGTANAAYIFTKSVKADT